MVDFTIRQAELSDAEALARVHVDTWRTAYRGIMTDETLDALCYDQRTAHWKKILTGGKAVTFVAAMDEVVGFANGARDRSEGATRADAELFAIYVREDHQGSGIGQALVRALAARFIELEFQTLKLWVLDANSQGGRFYRGLGGEPSDHKVMTIGGIDLQKTAYSWSDLSLLVG